MPGDPRYLTRRAQDLGFQLESLQKVWALTDLLRRLMGHPSVGPRVLLRGGTAINFLFANVTRLSVDIDLDYVGALDRARMLSERPDLVQDIRKILDALGYQVVALDRGYALNQWILRYDGIEGRRGEVKLELNWLNRLPILPIQELIFHSLFEIPAFPVRTLAREELFAGKIVTFLSRHAARDLFDLFLLASGRVPLDETLLRKLTVFIGCAEEEDFRRLLGVGLPDLDPAHVERDLRPLLRLGEEFDVPKVISTVKEFLEHVLNLPDEENQFVEDFYRKQVDPGRLFGTYQITPHIREYPNLIWRLQHMQ